MVDDVRLSADASPSRVSLFITCFNDTMFPQTGRAVVTVLERLGVAVDFPLEQTCCGQMHFNTGYAEETIPLVRRFVRVFGDAELVVSPSASCVGMVRDYYARVAELSGDAGLAREVRGASPPGCSSSPSCSSTGSGSRTWARTSRDGSPITPPATACACCMSATGRCACCAP